MATWNFAGGKGITPRGMNNGEIDTFKSAPIRSLAREICQNSLDALPPEEKKKRAKGESVPPVVVRFSSFDGNVPERQTLLERVNQMRDYWKGRQKNDHSVVEFLNGVLCNLTKGKIPFLRISDFNTTGLCGVGVEGSPWDNLVTSVGASDKQGDDGGSKGVGHAAPFACSSVQTVFYYTQNIDGRKAFEGVSRLVGWKDEEGTGYEEIGYFGNGDVSKEPLENPEDLGDHFARDVAGSDIYIAGFNQSDWEIGIIQSALGSFLLAFYLNKLALFVGDKEISAGTLPSCIESGVAQRWRFVNHADQYYRVLTSPATKTFTLVDPEGIKGALSLKLLIDPTLDCRRVALVRDTGMLIYEQDHINGSIRFAGVLEVQGTELNSFLRKLENGQHTEWSAERAIPEDRQKARNIIKDIGRFCREKLLSMNEIKPGEKLDTGLGCTSSAGDSKDGSSTEEEEDVTDELTPIVGHKKERPKKDEGSRKKRKKVKVKREESEDTTTDGVGPGQDPTPPPGTNPVVPPDHAQPKENPVKWEDVGASDLDYVCIDKENSEYQLVFTPDNGFEKGMVKLYVMAETDAYDATVLAARHEDGTLLQVSKGNVIEGLDFVKGKQISIVVKLDYTDYCSLEVEAYGHN